MFLAGYQKPAKLVKHKNNFRFNFLKTLYQCLPIDFKPRDNHGLGQLKDRQYLRSCQKWNTFVNVGPEMLYQRAGTKNVSYIDFWPGMTPCLCGW
jgi:hypothetical protein